MPLVSAGQLLSVLCTSSTTQTVRPRPEIPMKTSKIKGSEERSPNQGFGRRSTIMRCSTVPFYFLCASIKFLLCGGSGFDSLVAEFMKKRSVLNADLQKKRQQYFDKVGAVLRTEGHKMHQTEGKMTECVQGAQTSSGSDQYQTETLNCLAELNKKTSEHQNAIHIVLVKARAEFQDRVQKIDEELDELFEELKVKSEGYSMLNDDERIEFGKLEQVHEGTKREHAMMLRTFDAGFSDTICIDIANVDRELDILESSDLATQIIPYISQDFTDLGMDYYIDELSLMNQTLQYYNNTNSSMSNDATEGEEGQARGLRGSDSRLLFVDAKPHLSTEWHGNIRYYRGVTNVDIIIDCTALEDCYHYYSRKLAEVGDENNPSFRRMLQNAVSVGINNLQFPTTERVVQHVFESRLLEMKAITTEGTTVYARPCGVWPLTDPLTTIVPEQLKDLEEFNRAHQIMKSRRVEERGRYENSFEKEKERYQDQTNSEELHFMSCLNGVDQQLIEGEIDMTERKVLYDECFNEFDEKDTNFRNVFVKKARNIRAPYEVKLDNLEKKLTRAIQKLDEEAAQVASEYLERLRKEREDEEKTKEEIAEELSNIHLKFSKGIMCNFYGLKREFLDDEILILTDLVERGANYAFSKCRIDLHVYDSSFLDQEFVDFDRRLMEPQYYSWRRRLGSRLTVRFKSLFECSRCTTCNTYSDSMNTGSCGSCCYRRRILTDDIFRYEQVTGCFDRYMTPRVKKLTEVRLQSAIEDERDGVYVECSMFDELIEGE